MSEGEPREEKKPSVLEEEDVKNFIERRQIHPEDFHLIETLAKFPPDLVVAEFHNTFTEDHEKSLDGIRRRISVLDNDPKHAWRGEVLRAMLQFAEKYDWGACVNLVMVLEERKIPWRPEDLRQLSGD